MDKLPARLCPFVKPPLAWRSRSAYPIRSTIRVSNKCLRYLNVEHYHSFPRSTPIGPHRYMKLVMLLCCRTGRPVTVFLNLLKWIFEHKVLNPHTHSRPVDGNVLPESIRRDWRVTLFHKRVIHSADDFSGEVQPRVDEGMDLIRIREFRRRKFRFDDFDKCLNRRTSPERGPLRITVWVERISH